MQIELSSSSVRTMADRVVKTHPDLAKPLVLELLAHAFGYRNFDTLSGVLKNESAPAPAPALPLPISARKFPVTLWLECRVLSDYGSCPAWARLELTEERLRQLLTLQAECSEKNLSTVSVFDGPDEWDENAGANRYYNMRDAQLCVSKIAFWFSARPKHAEYNVETVVVYFDTLLERLSQGTGGSHHNGWIGDDLYFAHDSVADLFYELPGNKDIDGDYEEAVAEWVGLHFHVNYASETPLEQLCWVNRYRQAHANAEH